MRSSTVCTVILSLAPAVAAHAGEKLPVFSWDRVPVSVHFGIGAGLVNVLFSAFNPSTWGTPVIGASGAIYGVLVAYAILFPNRLVYVYFLIPVRVKYLVIFLVVLEFLL